MIQEIYLPDLGEGIEMAEVSEVSVSAGETVEPDDTILVLESEKASMEIPAEVSGIIKKVLVVAGEEIKPGQPLIKIDVTQSKEKSPRAKTKEKLRSTEKGKEEIIEKPLRAMPKTDNGSKERVFASPGVRRLARELGINLKIIQGSGLKGRITKDDLNGYIKFQMAMSSDRRSFRQAKIDFSQWGEIETQKMTRVKRVTSERLQQAWQTIPHVTQFDEADITGLDKIRKEMKTVGLEKNIKVTLLPFLMKAVVIILKEMPEFNSSLDHTGENIVFKNYYHIGVAVDTPTGLMVPVVRDVDGKSIFELSAELMDISHRARIKRLKPNEMMGGTFTISSLGGIGGTGFSPIVNPPEVAIMGISRSRWEQVFDKESNQLETRFTMPFSLSYDHRVIDGAAAAKFTSRFASALKEIKQFKESH